VVVVVQLLIFVVAATLVARECPWLSEPSAQTAEVGERRQIALVRA
jgi:biopolymer transport protein ExbD